MSKKPTKHTTLPIPLVVPPIIPDPIMQAMIASLVTPEVQAAADHVGVETMIANRGMQISRGTLDDAQMAKLMEARHKLKQDYPISPADRPQ